MPKRTIIRKTQHKYASELLSLIPSDLHSSLIEAFKVDQNIRKLKGELIFKLLFYSVLREDTISLRTLSHHSSTSTFQGIARQACETLPHNSIRRRLLTISVDYFRGIYEHLYSELESKYKSKTLKQKYHIKRFDSTMVATFAHLLEGMRVGNISKNKRQVKYTTDMTDEGLLNIQFFSDQAHVGDETTFKEVIEQATLAENDIAIFDAGLKSRKTFAQFEQAGISFITRLNTNPLYEVIRATDNNFTYNKEDFGIELPTSAPVIDDQIVYLFAARYEKIEQEFRLIRLDIGQEHPLAILTNILHLPPEIIGALYRSRWDIEVLFRFLKQELSFSHILSHHRNAIQVMIYMTLITAMMILIYKKLNKIRGYWKAKALFLEEIMEEVFYLALHDKQTQIIFKERLALKRPDLIRKIE